MEWVNTQDKLPDLIFEVDGRLESKRMLVYYEAADEYAIGKLVQNKSGRRRWITSIGVLAILDIDYWQPLPEIPSE